MAELQNGAVLPHKCQAVAHVVGIHGPTDDAVGVSDAGIQVIYQIGHMRIAVEDLREGGAFLEFQILDFIVVIVHVAEPEFGAFIVDHAGLAVGDGDPNVHICSGHMTQKDAT